MRIANHVEQQNIIEIQCAGAAKQAEEQRKNNRKIILKLIRTTYFLAKNCIPHSTIYKELVELQVLNGDKLHEKHLSEGPSKAQYTSRFSARMLTEMIDIWIKRKLMCSFQRSSDFYILADECQDISTQEELSIYCKWSIIGKPVEHFLMVLVVWSPDSSTLIGALLTFLQQKQLDLRKLTVQGYDGAVHLLGREVEFIREFRPTLLMQSTSTVLVTGYS